MNPLDDGTYDGVVVDARNDSDDALHVEIALSTGPHKGDVVPVRMRGGHTDPLHLLGLPARLVVRDGRPHLEIET